MCYTHLLLLVALVGVVGASVIERPRVRSYSPFAKNPIQPGRDTYVDEVKTQAQNQFPVVVPSWSAVAEPVVPKKNYSPFKSVKAQIAPVESAPSMSKKNFSPFKSVKAQAQIAPVAVPVVASVAVASNVWSAVAEPVAPKKNYSPYKSVKAQSQIAPVAVPVVASVAVPVVASVAVASNVWSAVAEPVAPKKSYSPYKSVKAQIQSQTAFVAVPVVVASVAVATSGWSAVAEFAAPPKKSYSPFKSVQAQAQARPTAYVAPDLMSSLRAAPATVTPASPATPPPSSIFSLLARRVSGIVRMLKLDRLRVIAASVVAALFFGKKKTSLVA